GLKSQWFIADVFCWWPLGYLMRWLGGLPIDRTTRNDLVAKMITKFAEEDELLLGMYPEGTTRKTDKWKTGFWHIAKGAGVPIQLVGIDYKERVTIFGPVLNLSENVESDMKKIKRYFKDMTPKSPENFAGEYIQHK
ncbi:MAG: acyltransferase, partial [Planctomycetia bacterium]|nr:acyltransferase [Planctomycetia bacterium]